MGDAILAALPDFSASAFRILNDGWDCVAVEADGRGIFKFPRRTAAESRLRRECQLLAFLRQRTAVSLPEMILHEGPRLFSQHRMLAGRALETPEYERLTGLQRDALAETLAGFYADLHAIPLAAAHAAGAVPIDPWPDADEILTRARPTLPAHLVPFFDSTIAAYRIMPADTDETIFGHFDGHGWNMAFDHETGILNGLFDFADAGFGARHQDLSYSSWISPDLTLRIISRYERLTGRNIDRGRVMLYSAALRCIEFAQAAPDRPDFPARLRAVEEWVRWLRQDN